MRGDKAQVFVDKQALGYRVEVPERTERGRQVDHPLYVEQFERVARVVGERIF